MEAYERKDDPSSPSSDGSVSSRYTNSGKRLQNNRKRWCKNDNRSRNLDCYREETFDGKAKKKCMVSKVSVNEGDDSNVNLMDQTFMEQNTVSVNTCTRGMQLIADRQMTPHTNPVVMNTFPFMGMHTQPNIPERMGMLGFCQYDAMGRQEEMQPGTEVMYFTNCILYPRRSFVQLPSPRDRPFGCKIIVVTGLPEKTTEEIVREVFGYCGKILSVHMGRKNFCYVCFSSEDAVDKSVVYSGYVMQIEDKESRTYYTGTIYIDYAEAKDIHCQSQRKQEDFNQHTYLSVGRFGKEETTAVITKLKEEGNFYEGATVGTKVRDEGGFYEALHTLIGWLVKGECVKSNADEFYTLIMTTQRLCERIHYGKGKYVDKKNEAEHKLVEQVKNILRQFNLISKFFSAVRLQKVWDHFSKAQRKNIEKWQEEFEEIKNASNDELLQQRVEDDMDISDDEGKKSDTEQKSNIAKELEELQEQKELLSRQLEKKEEEKENLKRIHASYSSRIRKLEAYENIPKQATNENTTNIPLNKQVHLISLISTFLSAHRFGASIDYICSYLQQFDSSLKTRDIETLMKNFPSIFNENLTGIGASLEKKWTFCDLKPQT